MVWRATPAVLFVLLAGCAVADDKYPPGITSVLVNDKPPSSLILSSTKDITFSCQSEGGTPIYWQVPPPSQIFNVTNGRLTIPKREMDYKGADFYNGDYTCFTNNTKGTAVASPVKVQIALVQLNAPDRVSVNVNVGDTVVLQCHTTGVVRPRSLVSSLNYVWYWQSISNPGAFGRTDFEQMYVQTQGRIAVDENSRLFIRNVQRSDFDSSSQFIGCRTKEQIYVSAEMDAGKYSLVFVGASPSSVAPTLVYSTEDVTIIEGGNITLACIFNDVDGKLEGAVTWSRSYTFSKGNGTSITVIDAQQEHNGTWECYYKNLKGTVNVFVKLIPRVSGVTDIYATTGGTATFTCSFQFADTPLWYKNDKIVNAALVDIFWPTIYTQEMRLRNVGKDDVGVYSCEAKNEIATIRVNGRLIVTDPAVGNVSVVIDAGKSVGTLVTINVNTTSIKVGCSFTADPLIENPTIVWRMSKFSDDISESTVRYEYGLLKGSVVTAISTLRSFMALLVYEDRLENVIGNVTCVLKYRILNRHFSDPSANCVEIVKEAENPSTITWISVNENSKFIWPITATVIAAVSITVNVMFCACLYRLGHIRLRKGRLSMTKVCTQRSQMASTVRSLPTTDAPAETTDSMMELAYSSAPEIEAPYTSLQHSPENGRIYEPLSHFEPN